MRLIGSQRAACAAEVATYKHGGDEFNAAVYKLIAAENEERRKAAQFKGEAGPGRGKKNGSVENDRDVSRDHKAEDSRSTAGQIAAKAGVSLHKAKQAIAI